MNKYPQSVKRIFLAVDIPKEIGRIMPMIKSVITAQQGDIRWLSGYHLHLTLSFLGNVADDRVRSLIDILSRTDLPPSFRMSIEKTGMFPDMKSPRILWLGIGSGAKEISNLQELIDGIAVDYKEISKIERFTPHITVGRIGKKVRTDNIDFINFINTEYEPVIFPVRHLVLYESKLLPDGPRYTVLEKFPLK